MCDETLTRKELAAQIQLSPRCIASIENSGQTPSLQVFFRLVTHLDMSVDQFFFPEKSAAKTTQRRQLDALLDSISENGLRIITAAAKEIADTEQKNSLK
ncbi:TPA: helix-turn-helix domain-containing protein [Streptococcus agalactiae]